MKKCIKCGSHAFNLYAEGIDQGDLCDVHYWQTKAQRQWVGLTDEEAKDALISVDAETKRLPPGFKDFAKAIEAKLRSKNT
jgi:hypothetical protein